MKSDIANISVNFTSRCEKPVTGLRSHLTVQNDTKNLLFADSSDNNEKAFLLALFI